MVNGFSSLQFWLERTAGGKLKIQSSRATQFLERGFDAQSQRDCAATAQGCEGRATLGNGNDDINPNGVAKAIRSDSAATPSGLTEFPPRLLPKVARPSQPWAG